MAKTYNYMKCSYLVGIVGGLKSISTFLDVCEEGVNTLRDQRQKILLLDKGGRIRRYGRNAALKHDQASGFIKAVVGRYSIKAIWVLIPKNCLS